jgi:hypothetical protein
MRHCSDSDSDSDSSDLTPNMDQRGAVTEDPSMPGTDLFSPIMGLSDTGAQQAQLFSDTTGGRPGVATAGGVFGGARDAVWQNASSHLFHDGHSQPDVQERESTGRIADKVDALEVMMLGQQRSQERMHEQLAALHDLILSQFHTRSAHTPRKSVRHPAKASDCVTCTP